MQRRMEKNQDMNEIIIRQSSCAAQPIERAEIVEFSSEHPVVDHARLTACIESAMKIIRNNPRVKVELRKPAGSDR